MLFFNKRNLLFPDYNWTAYDKNDSRISGKPDNTPFDKTEGYQVIYLINKLMTIWNYRFVNTGNKMERLIREKLPQQEKTQEDVQRWLLDNLKF